LLNVVQQFKSKIIELYKENMIKKFDDIDYLKDGTKRQQQTYSLLTKNQILSKLKDYSPILVGTIPINIDIESSDIDIICHWTNKYKFITTLKKAFNTQLNFKIVENLSNKSVTTNFFIEEFEVEIFGQNIPTKKQDAYRHMIVENQLLEKKGKDFRNQIIKLKKKGYKTEPAFAFALGLKGNPYTELLRFENKTDKITPNP